METTFSKLKTNYRKLETNFERLEANLKKSDANQRKGKTNFMEIEKFKESRDCFQVTRRKTRKLEINFKKFKNKL